MNRFFRAALEDESIVGETPTEEVADANLEREIAETELAVQDTQAASDSIEEVEAMDDTLGELQEQVEESLEEKPTEEPVAPVEGEVVPPATEGEVAPVEPVVDGEERKVEEAKVELGIEPTTAEAMESIVDHFTKRLGLDKARHPSLEDFGIGGDKVYASRIVLENIKDLRSKIGLGMHVAQEGFFSRLGNSIKLAFTSKEKIQEKLIVVNKKIEENGVKEDVIKEPGWGHNFSVIDKKDIIGTDVISFLTKFNKLISSPKLKSVLLLPSNVISKVSWDKETKIIEDLDNGIQEMRDISNSINSKTANKNPSFTCLKEQEAKKIFALANEIISNKDFAASIRMYKEVDIKAPDSIVHKCHTLMSEIVGIYANINHLVFATARYLEASAK